MYNVVPEEPPVHPLPPKTTPMGGGRQSSFLPPKPPSMRPNPLPPKNTNTKPPMAMVRYVRAILCGLYCAGYTVRAILCGLYCVGYTVRAILCRLYCVGYTVWAILCGLYCAGYTV